MEKADTNVTKSSILDLTGVLDMPLCIHVDVVLIIINLRFSKYILIHKSLLILTSLFGFIFIIIIIKPNINIVILLLFNIATLLLLLLLYYYFIASLLLLP